MLVLECTMGLCSKQGDITCAFLLASFGKDEAVYIEMPQGFKQYDKNGKPKVLNVGRVRFRRLVLILTLVSIGRRRQIGVASKIPSYLL
jgi:hypothetical protein